MDTESTTYPDDRVTDLAQADPGKSLRPDSGHGRTADEDHMRSEPRGYWTHVFDQAATLLRARPELNGDQAYWLARRMVDQTLQEGANAILALAPTLNPEHLVLAP